jgi:peroxiredoxin
LPDVKRLYDKYKNDKELVFLTISITQVSSPEYLKDIVRVNNIEFPVLNDPDWTTSSTYSASGIPVTYFIDRLGIVRDKMAGAATLADFERGLAKIMTK